mgnify:CR=1 FL=1
MTIYVLHSGIRKLRTRSLRRHNPMTARSRFVQKLGGGAILVRRARPARVTGEVLARHLEEIKAQVAKGALEVRTLTGQLVDLVTFKSAELPVTKPQPEPPVDSLADDHPADDEPADPDVELVDDGSADPDVEGVAPDTTPALLRQETPETAAAKEPPEPVKRKRRKG